MRGKWLLFSAIVVLAAVGAAALSLLRNRATPAAAERAPGQAQQYAGPEISLPGTIRAQSVETVAVPLDGTLDEVLVDAGQPVYEGQLLGSVKNTGLESEQQAAVSDAESASSRVAELENEMIAVRLETSRAQADAARAQSEYERTERNYLREKMLLSEGATPKLVYEKAESEYRAAATERQTRVEMARVAEQRLAGLTARLDAARTSLEDKTAALEEVKESVAAAEIHSPVTGFLVAVTRHAGDEVTTEISDLFQIAVDLTNLEAVVEPPPPALARVRPGQDAIVVAADVPEPIPGKVKAINGSNVVVEFTSPNPAIRPGSSAQVRIKLN